MYPRLRIKRVRKDQASVTSLIRALNAALRTQLNLSG